MTDTIYASLAHVPEEKDVAPDKDLSECGFRQEWGFTIYRTAYDSGSERYWEAIIKDLQEQVPAAINKRTKGQPVAQAEEIFSLFWLDVQSDKQRLEGLTTQQMREHCLQAANSESDLRLMNAFRPPMLGNHLLLLVDEEVISAAVPWKPEGHQLWVKCVDADYTAEKYVCRNSRVRQTYLGWMKMTTRSLVNFREHLEIFNDIRRIAPCMLNEIGRAGLVWDGEDRVEMETPIQYGFHGTPTPAG